MPPATMPIISHRTARLFRTSRRLSVVLAATATAAALLLAGPTSAVAATHAPTAGDPVAGAVYLGAQLKTDHLVFAFDGTTPDYGSTVDAIVALSAAKVGGAAITAMISYLATPAVVADYADPSDVTFGGPYPGSYAKLALAAEITGRNPAAFGGTDLIAQLTSLQCPALATPGACATWESGEFKSGNLANGAGFPGVVAQTYDVIATQRAGATAAATAGSAFLAAQQCADGSFANDFKDNTTVCASGGDVDATAAAIQGLLAAPGSVQTVAANHAVAWLLSQQRSDGSYVNALPPSVSNVNSTALAVAALRLAGSPVTKPLAYLAANQFGCGSAPASLGAFKFAGAADVRATNQAVAAVAGANLLTLSSTGAATALPTLLCAAPSSSAPAPTATASSSAAVAMTATTNAAAATASSTGTVTVDAVTLPATGLDLGRETGLAALAAMLIGLGVALIHSGRRRAR
ncbi:MAG: LPXTG-motif cell wall anchor domain protein [Frankiales bacterium]|nr:LPXTG-motif cell wall anchor domain protein [Frankiales bacterium]